MWTFAAMPSATATAASTRRMSWQFMTVPTMTTTTKQRQPLFPMQIRILFINQWSRYSPQLEKGRFAALARHFNNLTHSLASCRRVRCGTTLAWAWPTTTDMRRIRTDQWKQVRQSRSFVTSSSHCDRCTNAVASASYIHKRLKLALSDDLMTNISRR